MLRLYIGPAGAGKTAAVMEELHARVQAGRGGGLLLVPEQYSHEAERELCRRCGDSLSRYAEVVSFTGLARRVLSERGGAALPFLDKGGKLLCMALAVRAASHRLKVYDTARSRTELPELMLAASDELKSAGVSPEKLAEAAAACEGQLADKLTDAALILSAYEAVVSNGRADPSDRLDLLAEKLAAEGLGEGTAVYADGFIDFTRQERKVLRALLQRGAELTVCLTLDSLEGGSELFELSRKAARALLGDAGELGVEIELRRFEEVSGKAPALRFFAREMFGWSPERFGPADGALRLLRAESPTAECEAAAARILELVRAGCRWREIAVAVRGFEDYRPLLESVFRHYGVPLFLSRRSELLQKPLPALIERAYAILESGWDVEDLTDYMRTGLTGLSVEDCDTLENYVYKWQLRGGAWKRPAPWRQHPDGYGAEFTDETAARLAAIDRLRRRLAGPLLAFERRSAEASTASGQAAALAAFLEDLRLPELLARRAAALRAGGQAALADETRQLWEIVVGALEQSEAILGDAEMDRAAFGKLFCRMLSTYDVGTIPVSLDQVTAGDFDRMRRRSLRHLIVLGAADSRLPPESAGGGLFTPEDREKLLTLDIDLGGTGDAELWREFSLIYNVLTLPSDSLTLCFAETDAAGEAQSPAFVYNRAAALFEDAERRADPERCRLAAAAPALTLAANALHGGDGVQRAAAELLRRREPERFAALEAAASLKRGRLSPRAAEALYGSRPRLSASKADSLAACRFRYFCQYGLQAQPYEPAGFTPPEVGAFIHTVLERTLREVKNRGGFGAVSDEALRALARQVSETYIHEELDDFQEKSPRFEHLFRRLIRDAELIVLDAVQELRRSDFEPLDFELNFSKAVTKSPLRLGAVRLSGVADRVDGWVRGDKLYLRVVDYKTGVKKFSLSDVWYGLGMQMLLYLFALQENGEEIYGRPVEAAGIMYLPARSALLSLDRDDGEALERERADALRRSGLVLDDAALIEAWERGEDKRYIPIRFNRGRPGSGLASAEQLGKLRRHVQKTLGDMAEALREGRIEAEPYYRTANDNACSNCDFADACQFSDGENGERCRVLSKLKNEEVWEKIDREVGENG